MICFEVTINGEKICTAGVGDAGVLSSLLTFAKKRASADKQGDGSRSNITLRVGGMADIDDETNEHLEWFVRQVNVGDEIFIRIIERAESDPPPSKETSYLRCSFCERKQSEVLKLVAGPHAFICNECVSSCTQAITEGMPTERITLVLGKQAEAGCSFCGKKPKEVERVVGVPKAHICNECIAICLEILADGKV